MNPAVSPEVKTKKDSWWFLIDPIFIVSTFAISVLGVLLVYSATRGDTREFDTLDKTYLHRQAIVLVLGLLLGVITAFLNPRHIRLLWYPAYVLTIIVLGLVLVWGVEVNGTRGWLELGSLRFQPSEPAKLVLISGLALLKSPSKQQEETSLAQMLKGLITAIIPTALVLSQPDLGTALVYLVITFVVIAISGVKVRWVLLLIFSAVGCMAFVFTSNVLEDYQQARLTVFLLDSEDISREAAAYAYNAEQAQIAIGNGGLLGQGLFNGSQTQSRLVPAQHTDFIFTVVGEELGLRGAAILLGLYSLLLLRIWQTAIRASSAFDRLVCTGVFTMLSFQMFQAVGMTVGMMPVTGIPLPLVSYGGSSILTSMIALGLVANVYRRRLQADNVH